MARRKRDPEPEADAEAVVAPGIVILTCEQEGGAVSEIETTLDVLTGEGVELPNYVRRVAVRLA
jgi:hypothetical protein